MHRHRKCTGTENAKRLLVKGQVKGVFTFEKNNSLMIYMNLQHNNLAGILLTLFDLLNPFSEGSRVCGGSRFGG